MMSASIIAKVALQNFEMIEESKGAKKAWKPRRWHNGSEAY
ncbi:MAG: hypothetical protein PHD26_03315 [Methanosarcinaceae archaeon]|nr:hypothetical protein [Methanosarcinaceae archaeon]